MSQPTDPAQPQPHWQPGYQPPLGPPPVQPPAPPSSRRDFWLKGPGVILVVIAVGLALFSISLLSGVMDKKKISADAKVVSCSLGAASSLQTATVGISLTNTGDKTRSFTVDIEYRDGSGSRIDTDTAYVRDVAPGDTVRVDESTLLDATVSSGTCEIVGVR